MFCIYYNTRLLLLFMSFFSFFYILDLFYHLIETVHKIEKKIINIERRKNLLLFLEFNIRTYFNHIKKFFISKYFF